MVRRGFSQLDFCSIFLVIITSALELFSRSISMVIDGKIFEKGFISESKFLNESTPSGQKILPKVPL